MPAMQLRCYAPTLCLIMIERTHALPEHHGCTKHNSYGVRFTVDTLCYKIPKRIGGVRAH